MPVYNPFMPWTYQQNRPKPKPGQPKPATTESPIPATARPVRPPLHVGLEGVWLRSPRARQELVKEMVVSEYLREMQARQAAQPKPQPTPALPKPGKPVLEGLTAQTTGTTPSTAQSQLPTITPSTLKQPGGLGEAFMSSAFEQSVSRLQPGTQVTATQTTTTQQLRPAEKAGVGVAKFLAEGGPATYPVEAPIGFFLYPIATTSQFIGWAASQLGTPQGITQYFNYPAEFYAGLNLGAYEARQGIQAPRGLPREAWQFLTGTPYITPYSIGALAGYVLPIAGLKAPKLAETLMHIDPSMLMMTGLGRGMIRAGAWLESAGSSLAERLAPRAASIAPGSSIYRLGEFLGDIAYFAGRGMRYLGSALTPVMIEREPIVRFERVGEGVFKPELELVPTRVRTAPIQTGISEFVPGLGTIRIIPTESRVVGALTREGEVAGARGVRVPLVRALVEELPPERATEVLREVRYVIGYPGRLPIEAGFLAGTNVEFERAQLDVFDALRRMWQESRAVGLANRVFGETRSPQLAGLVYRITRELPVTGLEAGRFGSFMRDVEEAAITSKDFSEFIPKLAQIARRYGLEAPPSTIASELYSELMGSLRTMATLESQGLVRPGAQAIRFIASEMPGQPYLLEYGPARAFGLGETGELVSVLEGTENLPRVGYAVTPYGRLLTTITEEEAELPPAIRAGEEAVGGAGERAGAEAGTELQQLERLGLTREQAMQLLRQAESMETRFAPIGGAELGALAKALEEARQSQQPIATGGGSQVTVTIQRPETTPREAGRESERGAGMGGIGIGGGGGGGDREVEEYWTWVIPYERRGFAITTPPYVPIQTTQTTRITSTTITPPTTYEAPTTGTYTENPPVTATQTPTIETPVPPTAVPAIPPFLIPLLPLMPGRYSTAATELARPGTMREILVL